jgi:hypothetical protein
VKLAVIAPTTTIGGLVVKTRLIALLFAAIGLVAAIVAVNSGRIDDATFYAMLLMVDHHAERAGFKF